MTVAELDDRETIIDVEEHLVRRFISRRFKKKGKGPHGLRVHKRSHVLFQRESQLHVKI